jgi:hypothetical protein
MDPVNSSSGESGSGDVGRRDQSERRTGSASEGRPEAWRLILADGSRTSAPATRADEASAPPRGAASAAPGVGQAGVRPASRGDHGGEHYETLADYLQDEDLTLLDLDLLSSDISLLSAEMVPAAGEELDLPAHSLVDESATLSARDLAHVIDAWPQLSADHRQAILWIAKGGRQAARYGN